MVADGDGEGLLGVFLLDDKAVEMRFDFLRLEMNSISLRLGSPLGGAVSTVSVWGEAKTTRSPNSCFMNSESFFWISSGDGSDWSELMLGIL